MRILLAFVAAFVFALAAFGSDEATWPQFRGPGGSGIADDQKPPVEFGPGKNVKWKVPVPSGISSPIVVGDKLVLTAFDAGSSTRSPTTAPMARRSGASRPRRSRSRTYHKTEGSPAASTPATDGQRIVTYFGSCGLFCYDLSGKELWHYDLPTAAVYRHFGSGVSPILVDGTVVSPARRSKDAKILAVDAATGQLKWEKKRQSLTSFCTPVVWDTPAGKQIVAAGLRPMIGYDLKTGEEKWTWPACRRGAAPRRSRRLGTLFFAGWSPGDCGGQGVQDADVRHAAQAGRRGEARLRHAGGLREDLPQRLLRQQRHEQGRQTDPRRNGTRP